MTDLLDRAVTAARNLPPEVQDEIERALRINEAVRLQKKWINRLKEKAFVRYF